MLFVGQMRPYKGVETLLAAVAGQSWLELTLVGEGTELASYQRLADRLSATSTSPDGSATLAVAQTYTWERCVTSYEEVLLDAVRCRYACMTGIALLPELDEEDLLPVRITCAAGLSPVYRGMLAGNFRTVTNQRWYDGQIAAHTTHTTHFNVGWGAKPTIEDMPRHIGLEAISSR